ncbi:hypothetical protein [Pseudomonas kurunegalensis]|uniref:Uncharacterized protein n=1 Tax=Pseudomonas kurunegalensis TaxID=485880 RepID=A0ACC5UKV2_9PSED|nr:hypothetical protein [Pseudomonas kurunegalensis]MBV4514997.1 hypothetical protein [Pseudomonas kurunegalensis]
MPTENRSSNTDPRDVFIRLNPLGLGEAELRKHSTGFEDPRTHSDYLLFLAGYRETHPAPQPHSEPIAWMVGTAFWWTKEEAERDAAATGLPIVGLGPITGVAPVQQHQGEPAAWRGINELGDIVTEWIDGAPPEAMVDLCGQPASFASLELAYSHADPAEVERCEARLHEVASLCASVEQERDALRAQLAEAHALLRDALASHGVMLMTDPPQDPWKTRRIGERIREVLSASAEPSAPNDCAICRDLGNQCMECEEAEFRQWADRHFAAADYRKTDAGVFIQDWMRHAYGAWCARGALTSKR